MSDSHKDPSKFINVKTSKLIIYTDEELGIEKKQEPLPPEPVEEEPATPDPVKEEPATPEPVKEEPANPEPVKEEPFFDEATAKEFEQLSERKNASELFEIRPASLWLEIASALPEARMLFDSMWYEGELCILFADTNVGKSILAVQICDSISRGVPIKGFEMNAGAQRVAYFDFEMSARQFQARYTDAEGNAHAFSDMLFRAELDTKVNFAEHNYKTFEAFLYDQLEQFVSYTGIKVLVIDNLSYLSSETEQAKDAYKLMNILNTLKRKYNLSMLVLAHTPKRDHSKPLEMNHLQGSKQIANLCDSIIAIGKSHKDNDLRYIKQVKHRMGRKMYESDNVCLCQVVKLDDFLQFELIGHCREREHLSEMADKELGNKIAAAKDLSARGLSQREIASQLGISLGLVNRYLRRE